MVALDVIARIEALPDPEIPVITIKELGIVRAVEIADGVATVTITPTYSGCPALDQIQDDIEALIRNAGFEPRIEMVYAPPWTTDWMSEEARQKLRAFGIAPPRGQVAAADLGPIRCPQCDGDDTAVVSRFASTACKALLVCGSCGEPFDHFREH